MSALYEEIRDAAGRLFDTETPDVLGSFGLGDLLAADDRHERNAAFAVAEAQGRAGAVTGVVSRIALAGLTFPEAAEFSTGVGRHSGDAARLAGLLGSRREAGLVVLACNGAAVGLPRLELNEVDSPLDPAYLTVFSVEPGSAPALDLPELADVLARARLACAAEMLGACEAMLTDAVAYTAARRQFGAALASFQAVAHSLAWAATEIHQLRALLRVSLAGDAIRVPDHTLAAATKSLAGTVSSRVAQTTLQVTGGMGFTWDYSHNARHRRVLALEVMAGSTAALDLELGRRLRAQDGPKIQDLQAISLTALAAGIPALGEPLP